MASGGASAAADTWWCLERPLILCRRLGIVFLSVAGAACSTSHTIEPAETGTLGFARSVNEEHTIRKNRLETISRQSLKAQPKFYEYLIGKSELAGASSDIPVLRVVFEERVFFDTAASDVRPDAEPILNVISENLRKEPPEVVLFVAGHTDSRGSEAYNLDLSVRRANSVAEAMIRRGVGQVKIWRVGFGKAVPLRANDSDSNMAINRRVEFILAGKFEAITTWLSKQPEFLCSDSTNIPELCKNPLGAGGTFSAAPVEAVGGPYVPLPSNQSASVPVGEIRTPKVKQFEITLKPNIQEVGPPTR